ncbi:hypothetical protein GQR58_030012 [Nymphon striatum]|nr:hypothetical protein GQR58_030012 [Nymphon striatum]
MPVLVMSVHQIGDGVALLGNMPCCGLIEPLFKNFREQLHHLSKPIRRKGRSAVVTGPNPVRAGLCPRPLPKRGSVSDLAQRPDQLHPDFRHPIQRIGCKPRSTVSTKSPTANVSISVSPRSVRIRVPSVKQTTPVFSTVKLVLSAAAAVKADGTTAKLVVVGVVGGFPTGVCRVGLIEDTVVSLIRPDRLMKSLLVLSPSSNVPVLAGVKVGNDVVTVADGIVKKVVAPLPDQIVIAFPALQAIVTIPTKKAVVIDAAI